MPGKPLTTFKKHIQRLKFESKVLLAHGNTASIAIQIIATMIQFRAFVVFSNAVVKPETLGTMLQTVCCDGGYRPRRSMISLAK